MAERLQAHYRDGLLGALDSADRPAARPAHALVSCIDTRSEGLRRHLESLGGYQTLGFAGFFAVAIRFTGLLGSAPSDLCLVLISPNHDVSENPAPGTATPQSAGCPGSPGWREPNRPSTPPRVLAAPFTLAEAAGWATAPLAAAKTLAPALSGTVRRQLRDALAQRCRRSSTCRACPTTNRCSSGRWL